MPPAWAARSSTGCPRKDPLPSLAQVLEGTPPAANRPVLEGFRPDTAGDSESGYVIVQQIAADAGGMPFPALAEEAVLGPLGMTDSTFEAPLPAGPREPGGLGTPPAGAAACREAG